MLQSWSLGRIAVTLGAKAPAATSVEAIPEAAPEPTLSYLTQVIKPKRRRFLEPAPKRASAKEHAEKLLEWICSNIDLSDGPITHAAIQEFYCEMLIEAGWKERPWNPVACEFRRLTTGSRKVYAWIETNTGALHRLRIYPIPERKADAAPTPQTTPAQIDSRGTPALRRSA